MDNSFKVVARNGNAVAFDPSRITGAVSRAMTRVRRDSPVPRSRHCSIAKDLPTDIGGADVAMQSAGADGAPVAASSEDDDGGGGDADPDGGRPHSNSQYPQHYPNFARAAHSASAQPLRARLLRLAQVKDRTGLSRSTIYQFIKDGKFPPSLSIGARAVAWLESDIDRWIAERVQASIQRAEAA
ncbi:prophage regulatory protein [Burkholderia multivorans]